MERLIEYTVPDEYDGKKLLNYLRGPLNMSARTVTKLRHSENGLLLNGEHIRTVDIIRSGDTLTVRIPDAGSTLSASAGEMPDIVYEDDDVMVINKPAGLAMHPTHNHQGDTLANRVAAYFADKNESCVFRAVGRLDKSTSGLVLCALNRHSAGVLSGRYEKEYLAVVQGEFTGRGTIDRPIYRPDPNKTLRAAGDHGDAAVTHWESLESGGGLTFVKVRLETGRTHQIRVHFSSVGRPLAGDEMYGGSARFISRAALHCSKISFVHPVSGENLVFSADVPDDMKNLLDLIRSS